MKRHRPAADGALSPAQDYSAEVLAYFLQVVVGFAGPPENRQAWKTTGQNTALDLAAIAGRMENGQFGKSDLLLMDTNLLGLSEVLYRYNPRLNQFKGRYVFNSVYPSSELIALRLLIQKKIRDRQKVSMAALASREFLLQTEAPSPSLSDLEAINLSADEFALIKDVFRADPLFFSYYKHPFMVETMVRIGFYKQEPLTEAVIRRASYAKYDAGGLCGKKGKQVNVAIIPSLTADFEFGGDFEAPYVFGFKPSPAYRNTMDALKSDILKRTADAIRTDSQLDSYPGHLNDETWSAVWQQEYLPRIQFQFFDIRPFSIYPENAEHAVKDLCPSMDLAIVVLGKGVYQAIDFETFPNDLSQNDFIFIDSYDIINFPGSEKIDVIARFISQRLTAFIPTTRDPGKQPAAENMPAVRKPPQNEDRTRHS